MRTNEYTQRNDILLDMGYKDYRQYLRSPLWKSIRKQKLTRDPECWACGRRQNLQVHHGKYTIENLTGLNDKHLYSICARCHEYCEFTRQGEKRTPHEATAVLRSLRRARMRRRRLRVDNRAKYARHYQLR